METIYLDGTSLSFDQVSAVAYGGPGTPRLEISAEAARLVTRAAVIQAASDLSPIAQDTVFLGVQLVANLIAQ